MGRNISSSIKSTSNVPYFKVKAKIKFTVLLWNIWGFNNWHPLLIIIHNILYIVILWKYSWYGDWFPSEADFRIPQNLPYPLNYYWNGILITLTIHSNPLLSIIYFISVWCLTFFPWSVNILHCVTISFIFSSDWRKILLCRRYNI